MPLLPLERRTIQAQWIFDVTDAFMAARMSGPSPRPLGWIRMFLTAKADVAGIMTALPVDMELVLTRNASGYDVFLGEVKLPDGSRRVRAIGPGSYDIRIDSQFYQTAVLNAVTLPMNLQPPPRLYTPIEVKLSPSFTYPFPEGGMPSGGGATLVRGILYQPDGTGVEGADVSVAGPAGPTIPLPYKTGPSGEWVLVFQSAPNSGKATIHFKEPGQPPQDVIDQPVVAKMTSYFRQTGFRGQVKTMDGRPIAGATIRVSGVADESMSRADGSWYFYFRDLNQASAGNTRVTAILPDGRSQHQDLPIQPQAVVFFPAFEFP